MSQWLSPGKYWIDPSGTAVAGPWTVTNPEPADFTPPDGWRSLTVGSACGEWPGTAEAYDQLAALVETAKAETDATLAAVDQTADTYTTLAELTAELEKSDEQDTAGSTAQDGADGGAETAPSGPQDGAGSGADGAPGGSFGGDTHSNLSDGDKEDIILWRLLHGDTGDPCDDPAHS